MYSFSQTRRVRGAAGEPLPTAYQSLHDAGVVFRRGQLAMLCGGPGTGKSTVALNIALRSQASTLYISADSDAATQTSRALSIVTGRPYSESIDVVISDDYSDISEALNRFPIRFIYDASPTLDRIELIVQSYLEFTGDYPDFIILDNITNARPDVLDHPLHQVNEFLLTMARETQSCVLALHHVTGPYNDADKPIPLSGVKDQISDKPELILTAHRIPGDDYGRGDKIGISAVKNRSNKADASGKSFVTLDFDGSRMSITERKS